MAFHSKTGSLIALSNRNRTAQRRYASTEFNKGVVLSERPLNDNEIFEVKIDKRVRICCLAATQLLFCEGFGNVARQL